MNGERLGDSDFPEPMEHSCHPDAQWTVNSVRANPVVASLVRSRTLATCQIDLLLLLRHDGRRLVHDRVEAQDLSLVGAGLSLVGCRPPACLGRG